MKKEQSQIPGSRSLPILLDYQYDPAFIDLPVVILVHGFKGYKDWGAFSLISEYFAERGFFFLKFSFSHGGTTPEHPREFADLEAFGNNNFSIELNDLDRVIAYVERLAKTIPLDLKRISLIGHSRGGADVLLKALEDDRISRVVTWASVLNVSNYLNEKLLQMIEREGKVEIYNARTKQHMPVYKQFLDDLEANREKYDLEKRLPAMRQPLLVCHGTADESVEVKCASKIAKQVARSDLYLLEDAGHTFGASEPWLEEQMPGDLLRVVDRTLEFLRL
ncbi:MAG: alpha/beta fold hydrolase [Cytophagales bacterium]|nr:alpha/beta fold hydrolase [Cytophagales bacterium]